MDLYQLFEKFGIDTKLFEWPGVLFNFILPFILFSYALYLLLEKMKIFRSTKVHWGIAFIISLFTLILFSFGGSIVVVSSIFVICILKIRGMKGIVVGIICVIIYVFFLQPFLTSFLK